jgi:hypothetical protein
MDPEAIKKVVEEQLPGFELVDEEPTRPREERATPGAESPPISKWRKFSDAAGRVPEKVTGDPRVDRLRSRFLGETRERAESDSPGAAAHTDTDSKPQPDGPTGQPRTVLRHVRPKASEGTDAETEEDSKAILIRDGKIYSSQG